MVGFKPSNSWIASIKRPGPTWQVAIPFSSKALESLRSTDAWPFARLFGRCPEMRGTSEKTAVETGDHACERGETCFVCFVASIRGG